MESKFISYSQHADDYLAWQFLGRKKTGLVIEVGAFDGIHLSNSYSLENIGWKSICVEPNPKIFEYLKINRPKASCISCAVVDDSTMHEVEFHAEEIGVLSGITMDVEDVENRYKRRGIEFKTPEKIKVTAMTLDSILSGKGIQANQIDIISIDVEGYELNVLNGFNINHYKPSLIIIEANNDRQIDELFKYFNDHTQYIYLGSNRQNLFFMLREKIDRKFLKNVDFKKFYSAKQYHPIDQRLAIQSVPPLFNKSSEFNRITRSWFSVFFEICYV